MRAVLAAADPGVEVLAGRAEEIPAEASSVDVVIAPVGLALGRRVTVPSPRSPGCCARPAYWRPSGPDPTARSTGCDHCGQAASSSAPKRRPTSTVGGGGGISCVSTPVGTSPFFQPETKLFRWTRADDQGGSRGAVRDVQCGHHHGRGHPSRARFLEAMNPASSKTHEAFAGLDTIDVPMRSYCWRANSKA